MQIPRKKILLLTDVFPSNNYSGGIVNQQLCYFLLEENADIFCTLLKNTEIQECPDDFIKTHITKIEFERPDRKTLKEKSYIAKIKKITNDVISFIKEHQIDTVWCPTQDEATLRVYASLQLKLKHKIRFVAQIWDVIEWPLYELEYSPKDTSKVLHVFDCAMKNSDYILTASYPMHEMFNKKYSTPNAPIFSSYRKNTYCPPKKSKTTDKFIIILSGQTYAKKGIQSFIAALEQLKWHYANKEICIFYYGLDRSDFLVNNQHIYVFDNLPQNELVEIERQADLLYCPYYFEDCPIYQLVSQTSYPSKVITYIPAETPILIHSSSASSVYKDFKKHQAGFLLDSTDVSTIINKIKQIIKTPKKQTNSLVKNANRLFQENFTRERNKKVFMEAIGIRYNYNQPSYRILEINNLDLPGKRWNGYDLTEYTNKHTHNLASQIVTYKTSHNKDVTKIYTPNEQQLEYKLLDFEYNKLSVHSCLSCSSPILQRKDVFNNADILHLHLIHNMKLSLISLIEICNKKPTVITIHDPWTFTGRCVWLYDCKKYLTGCHNCPNLNNLFPLKCDNCHELWKLKKYVYDKLDVDYVVTTKYMYNLFKESPLTKGKRIHVIPFGINIKEFYHKVSQEKAKNHYNIPNDHIVIFHRAQFLSKGTEYVIEALKELQTDQKITIITCSEKGRLDQLRDRYNIIDLGDINSEELVYAYNACDFFLSPSIGESFCMMAVEAMSCAKPVIIFDNTALPSVTFAPECGIVAKDRDSHDLMKKIKWMIEDKPERLRRGKLARKIVCENYDLDVYNQRIQKLYSEIATRKHNYIDYESLLNQEPKDTPSVIALKAKLNSLTKSIFPNHSIEQNNMLYRVPIGRKNKKNNISYGDINTQLLINNYNNALINNFKGFDPNKLYGSLPSKIAHKAFTLAKMILHDRRRIKEVLKEKYFIKKSS